MKTPKKWQVHRARRVWRWNPDKLQGVVGRADVESLEIKEKTKSNIKITAREKTKENVDVAGFRGVKKRGDG